ncbi:hypothetical protein PG993_013263 [Apiospora rasikravindrae]|uniref:Uncharacterized protein n=1 Tax=Apiospora rasikravindrae TaxID=990691 RepID=A0ABR1RX52_9PEZI
MSIAALPGPDPQEVSKRIDVLQRLAAGNSANIRSIERDLKTHYLPMFTQFRSRLDTAKNVTEQHQRDAWGLATQLEQQTPNYASVCAKADLLEPAIMRMAVLAQVLRDKTEQ